jgi:predicted HTH transcriptional regulator
MDGLIPGMTKEDFFSGLSMPRNKELMRTSKDLDIVEHLGSGIPRILDSYGKECFTFGDNYLRITFLVASPLSDQVTPRLRSY